jgi:geranylgeranyl pyrophosphate synthase
MKGEIYGTVQSSRLGGMLEHRILEALSGATRVLPEGKPNLCSAVTLLSYSSAGGKDLRQAIPAVVAMEMLVSAYDIVDDLEDDEVPLPDNRRSMGYVLEVVCSLLMLCHRALETLAMRGVPPQTVLEAFKTIDRLGVDSLRGQTLDMDLEDRKLVTIETAMAASSLKSASLVRCCAELGAAVATDSVDLITRHAEFGWHFGLTLQLMNDIAAVWPGGSAKSDLRLRKKTLPIAFALSAPVDSNPHLATVRDFFLADGETPRSEKEVKWALWRCGAIHYTWIVSAWHKARATEISHELQNWDNNSSMVAKLLD